MSGILPAEHWASSAIVGDGDGDGDTASTTQTDTSSIASSILKYRELYGRTYHSESSGAQYWATNDEKQKEALDILHHMLTLSIDGKLYLAPLEGKKVEKVLDIGCGTGIWAMDFADEFPGASVIGTDLSPIQPSWVSPNVSFEIDDCTKSWTFPADSFDYIHIRWMLGSIVDWTALFKEAYQALRPGGYLESFEPDAIIKSDDGSIKVTDAMGQWAAIFTEGGRKMGRSFNIVSDDLQRIAMREAGFVEVEERNLRTPLGSWPKDEKQKEIGTWANLVVEHDTEGHILFLATTLGWTRESVIAYIKQLHREIRLGKKQGYYHQKVIWGRKPQ
ncbi:S-adenosyl-L-methionine-dependent methyltransferase [Lasiosphaeris hirsuta]|uniref:S-adenosyl-L-methionine-dependent methyltransferase n=1 Tax=Lasiosphaeris hirsuta TaxID=260670 RepID=A0AA40DJ76_9PEZI|nr:S-adenosyl-L-methionine-dependent methyltransferase [Lasiosphaeris hirsuta]